MTLIKIPLPLHPFGLAPSIVPNDEVLDLFAGEALHSVHPAKCFWGWNFDIHTKMYAGPAGTELEITVTAGGDSDRHPGR